jgi:hypothetical protein
VVLKTRTLLILRDAKNAENGKIPPNWNVFGTRTFQPARQFREEDLPSPSDFIAIVLAGQMPVARNSRPD